jgi:hypothetical protein
MTEYKNFIKDFPRRCRDILDIAGKPALSRGREVTLTIMVASAGFVVPYERLKPDHPSGDSKKFADAAEKLKSLLDQPFMSSVVCNKMNSTWHDGKVASVNGDPDSWDGLRKRKPFSKDKKVSTTLKVIRNGLAHGNIFTFGNPIQAIVFIKKNFNDVGVVRDYSFVFVAPREFLQFLENWFDFLNDFCIPQEVAFEVLKDAA